MYRGRWENPQPEYQAPIINIKFQTNEAYTNQDIPEYFAHLIFEMKVVTKELGTLVSEWLKCMLNYMLWQLEIP